VAIYLDTDKGILQKPKRHNKQNYITCAKAQQSLTFFQRISTTLLSG
jgi:hypothetical protein